MSSSSGAKKPKKPAQRTKATGLHIGEAVPGVSKVDPIIIADGVRRTFGGLTAVDVEHVEIPRGVITALIGPNGAGKTTLFNLLTGFDKPDAGSWVVRLQPNTFDVFNSPPATLSRRLGALVIDWAIAAIVSLFGLGIALGMLLSGNFVAGLVFAILAVIVNVALACYQIWISAKRGATIGKRFLGLVVLSIETRPGEPLGLLRTIGRSAVLHIPPALTIIGLVTYLSPLWDSTKRNLGWHDRIFGSEVFDRSTLVIKTPESDEVREHSLSQVPAFRVAQMELVRTFQLTKALGLLTVLENMKLGAKEQSGEAFWPSLIPGIWRKQDEEIEERAMRLLTKFKLDAKADDFAASLSGGQRKLLEMARALMSEPQLVMLDEPMAGVNPALTESLLDHILDLKDDGMTVLFVEHDMHMVRHIADWVIVMAEGKIVAEGDPVTVMKNPAVIDAYLGAHQDVDLGVVTGRHDDGSTAKVTAAQIEAEGLAELESEDK